MNERINLTILPMVLAAFSAALDNNVLNVCLPILAVDFSTDIGKVQFVSSAYVFTICSMLLIFAYISSAAGRKYIFSAGVGILPWQLGGGLFHQCPGPDHFQDCSGDRRAMFMANGMALIHSHFCDKVKAEPLGLCLQQLRSPVSSARSRAVWLPHTGAGEQFFINGSSGYHLCSTGPSFTAERKRVPMKSFDVKGMASCISFALLFLLVFIFAE